MDIAADRHLDFQTTKARRMDIIMTMQGITPRAWKSYLKRMTMMMFARTTMTMRKASFTLVWTRTSLLEIMAHNCEMFLDLNMRMTARRSWKSTGHCCMRWRTRKLS